MRIQILVAPREKELDGVRLDVFQPGKVCDVSSSVGAWLIANGYALAEMRVDAPATERRSENDRRRRLGKSDDRNPRPYRYR